MCLKVTVEHSRVDSKDFLVSMRCSNHCGPLVMIMQAQKEVKRTAFKVFCFCKVQHSHFYGIRLSWVFCGRDKHQVETPEPKATEAGNITEYGSDGSPADISV